MHYQGIDIKTLRNVNGLHVGNGSAKVVDIAISEAYGNRCYIPLDFELLESHTPFYQSHLGDRLEHVLTVNDYSRITISTVITSRNRIDNISLEHEIVTQTGLPALSTTNTMGG